MIDWSFFEIFASLQEMAVNCKSLKVLKLPNSPWYDYESAKEIFRNNPNLRQLDLTDCSHLKNGSLQPLVVNCKVSD